MGVHRWLLLGVYWKALCYRLSCCPSCPLFYVVDGNANEARDSIYISMVSVLTRPGPRGILGMVEENER